LQSLYIYFFHIFILYFKLHLNQINGINTDILSVIYEVLLIDFKFCNVFTRVLTAQINSREILTNFLGNRLRETSLKAKEIGRVESIPTEITICDLIETAS
jgi:hypothetical protein